MNFFFEAYAKDTTTSLGWLFETANKRIRAHYNGAGEGSFEVNRHSDEAAWCAAGNYIRVYIGNIFTDPVFGFFVGQGEDTTVSADEEGGEILTRGGPGALSYLERAIVDPTGANARYADGVWRWTDGTMGQIMADLIDDAQARGALPRLTYDFTAANDSNGAAWDVFDGDYDLTVGLNLFEVVGRLQSAGFIARMSHDFVLSAFKTIGADRSGTISFEKGVNIVADGEREVYASPAKSHMLVQGTTKNGALKFVWASDPSVQTALGERIEGFTSYQSTASDTVLGRVGTQAINRLKKRRDGLSQLGVLETTWLPFDDYYPGDTVNVNIPGEFNNLHAPVTAVAIVESETGEGYVALEFEDIAFEPLQLNDKTDPTQSSSSGGTGGGGGGGGGATLPNCCPPPEPQTVSCIIASPDLAPYEWFNDAGELPLFMASASGLSGTVRLPPGDNTGSTGGLWVSTNGMHLRTPLGATYSFPTPLHVRVTISFGNLIPDATEGTEGEGFLDGNVTKGMLQIAHGGGTEIWPELTSVMGNPGNMAVETAPFNGSSPATWFPAGSSTSYYAHHAGGVITFAQTWGGTETGINSDPMTIDVVLTQFQPRSQGAWIDYGTSMSFAIEVLDFDCMNLEGSTTFAPGTPVKEPVAYAGTGTYTLHAAFREESLHVSVNGVDWTENIATRDGAAGTFTLRYDPKPFAEIVVTYEAA
jgi:Siphovirus ReqiPepy6 Gp37-like protein